MAREVENQLGVHVNLAKTIVALQTMCERSRKLAMTWAGLQKYRSYPTNAPLALQLRAEQSLTSVISYFLIPPMSGNGIGGFAAVFEVGRPFSVSFGRSEVSLLFSGLPPQSFDSAPPILDDVPMNIPTLL
jgi:hypothetical protein